MNSKELNLLENNMKKFCKVSDKIGFLEWNRTCHRGNKFKSIKKFKEFKEKIFSNDGDLDYPEEVESKFINKYSLDREEVNLFICTIIREDKNYYNYFGFSYKGMTIFDIFIDSSDNKEVATKSFNDLKKKIDNIDDNELLRKLNEFTSNENEKLELRLKGLTEVA